MSTCVVTGANRGIGLELAKQLRDRGEKVIAACRKSSDSLKNLGVTIYENVDVKSSDSVTSFGEQIAKEKIDILINNAGIGAFETIGNMDFEKMLEQYEVNALGALRVTSALLPQISKGGKIIFITSRMGSIGDNTSGSVYGYRMSKAALNMAAVSLAQDLKQENIAVGILHPGSVDTDMLRAAGISDGISPKEAVEGLLARVDELSMKNTGTFWHTNGDILPW